MRVARPNVLVVMSDEQNWDTIGANSNPAAYTPHLDTFAERATSFDSCYTPFPLCCPSRTSLWTARMPRHHHVLGNWRAINPDLRDRSVATAFRDAGYHTMYTGKWHVPGTTPHRMGFTESHAIPAIVNGKDRGRLIPPYREYLAARGYELADNEVENFTPNDQATMTHPNRPPCGTTEIPLEDYLETWQTGQFLDALDQRPEEQPWFAVCSFNAPHFAMMVPEPYDRIIDRTKVRLPESHASGTDTKPKEVRESHFARNFARLDEDAWTEVIAHYLGFCGLVDAQFGRIVDYLERTGERANTIVVFVSDHGDMMGAHRLMEKGHQLPYEETCRVPLMIAHPDAAATRVTNQVSMTDIAPTLAHLAGVEFDDDHDGMSFAAMVGDATAPAGRTYVHTESVLYGMSANANGEYISPHDWDPATDALNLSVRTPTERYIFRSRDEDELYDHRTDPHEQYNLASDPAYTERTGELRRLLADEVADVFPAVPGLDAAGPGPSHQP